MLNILNPHNNIVGTTIGLTQHNKLPITNSTINTEIENHPDYPNLLSISDGNKWQINYKVTLPNNKKSLANCKAFFNCLNNSTIFTFHFILQ